MQEDIHEGTLINVAWGRCGASAWGTFEDTRFNIVGKGEVAWTGVSGKEKKQLGKPSRQHHGHTQGPCSPPHKLSPQSQKLKDNTAITFTKESKAIHLALIFTFKRGW